MFGLNANNAVASPPSHWGGTWAIAPVTLVNTACKYGSADSTFRGIVHVSLGRPAVRLVVSNEFGLDPLAIAAAHIALIAKRTLDSFH